MRINLTDNNIAAKNENNVFQRDAIDELFPIASLPIKQLCQENPNILIFPLNIENSKDRIGDCPIFTIENTEKPKIVKIITNNIIGYIGKGDLQVKIKSRFDAHQDDYFLHYMLQKIFSFNIFNLDHSSGEKDILDFLIFMFPYFLKSALRQGIYREYRHQEYNDAKVKGVINVNKFITRDIPFRGQIFYSTRNYYSDNDMTQLIRHTIEFIASKKSGEAILNIDRETIQNVQTIRAVTPGYVHSQRNNVIQKNLRPKIHPFYTEYKPLQSLCLQILRMDEIKYGETNDEICGLLFDVSWLWEEYVNSILEPQGFKHTQNRQEKGAIYLFEYTDDKGRRHRNGRRYPDYYKDDFVLDAKYKRLENCERVSKVDRNDIHQVITYMSNLKAARGGFVAPFSKQPEKVITARLKDTTSTLSIFGLEISKDSTTYEDFVNKMAILEADFVKSLQL